MNKVILMGRLTREPDVRYSQNSDGSMAVARYTLAVDRRRARTNSDGAEQTADFISCVAFGRFIYRSFQILCKAYRSNKMLHKYHSFPSSAFSRLSSARFISLVTFLGVNVFG